MNRPGRATNVKQKLHPHPWGTEEVLSPDGKDQARDEQLQQAPVEYHQPRVELAIEPWSNKRGLQDIENAICGKRKPLFYLTIH